MCFLPEKNKKKCNEIKLKIKLEQHRGITKIAYSRRHRKRKAEKRKLAVGAVGAAEPTTAPR